MPACLDLAVLNTSPSPVSLSLSETEWEDIHTQYIEDITYLSTLLWLEVNVLVKPKGSIFCKHTHIAFEISYFPRGGFRGGWIGWLATPLWSSKKKKNIMTKNKCSNQIVLTVRKIEYITFDNKTLYCAPKLSQNAGNAISETWDFKNSRGACPRTPLGARDYGARPYSTPATPLQKSWIRPCSPNKLPGEGNH